MSLHRCCLCHEPVAHNGPGVIAMNMHEDTGRIITRWCRDCFVNDPTTTEFAVGDAEEDDTRVSIAYLAMCDRIFASRGERVLRECIDVRRDLESSKLTLRGPGAAWGRRSPR